MRLERKERTKNGFFMMLAFTPLGAVLRWKNHRKSSVPTPGVPSPLKQQVVSFSIRAKIAAHYFRLDAKTTGGLIKGPILWLSPEKVVHFE